jgi:hypothetical protein
MRYLISVNDNKDRKSIKTLNLESMIPLNPNFSIFIFYYVIINKFMCCLIIFMILYDFT